MKLERKDCMLVMIVLIYMCTTLCVQHSVIMFLNYSKPCILHMHVQTFCMIPAQVDDFSRCNTQKQGFLEATNAKSLQEL